MIIANPIYDTVFKYLMEDLDIARDLISLILNTEIVELSVKPQETTAEVVSGNATRINIYRLDFVAVFKQADGTYKKTLVELQKTKRSTNIMRFRRYLGENYKKEDKIMENGVEVSRPLEIITIYFLGFELEDVPTAIMKAKNSFVDVITGNTLVNEPKDKFVRLLNHESYTIQIPKLTANEQNRMEHTLDVFNQKYKTDDLQILNYPGKTNDLLISRIINRLIRAIADENLRRQMNIEDEIETELQILDTKIENIKQALEQKTVEIEQNKVELYQKTVEIEQKTVEIEQKTAEIEQKTVEIEQKTVEIEQNKQTLSLKDQEIEALKRMLADKEK